MQSFTPVPWATRSLRRGCRAALRLALAASLLTPVACAAAGTEAEDRARPPVESAGPVPPANSVPDPPSDAFSATVVRVVDGDTVVATPGRSSRPLRVRLIGVDTPETVRPDTPVACFGAQAATLTARLMTGKRVQAAYEPGGRQDRFGRELWDVWLPDGRFLQAVLVSAGTARAYPYRPQVRYAAVLRRLADDARAAHRGLWGPPCNGRAFPPPSGRPTSR